LDSTKYKMSGEKVIDDVLKSSDVSTAISLTIYNKAAHLVILEG